ncbi:GNAT family N-acetyltransferase [Pseudarthrobacter sp. CC12]|uniref:GNAT family N-acetyltransferase n=1 Tax=Pseudarthrobacter sp. CC12 TaxID=3029193 RepID=UPI0032639ECD
MSRPAEPLSFAEIHPEDPRVEFEIAPLLRSLRPDLTQDSAKAFLSEAHTQGYVLSVCTDSVNRCCALSGHRVLTTSRGRILFVEDLAVAAEQREAGIGRKFMEYLERMAELEGCVKLELDTGMNNHVAQRFYKRNKMEWIAMHFSKSIPIGATLGNS